MSFVSANFTCFSSLTNIVGAQGQLYKLMQRLEETEPHFIRCIKPNTQQLANVFDQELVLQQLRCCGVLEVVRISRSGYPTRHSHHEFASRFVYAKFCHLVSELCVGVCGFLQWF